MVTEKWDSAVSENVVPQLQRILNIVPMNFGGPGPGSLFLADKAIVKHFFPPVIVR